MDFFQTLIFALEYFESRHLQLDKTFVKNLGYS